MPRRFLIASAALLVACVPVAAQELENSKTPATSGTVGTGTDGRTSGANLSAGGKGPASETQMPTPQPKTNSRENSAARAGASDTTKELFQH